jgi:acyl-CoA synthetase (NDP forming)
MRTDLERFFNPRAIAIIGASQDLSTISGQPLKFLKSHGYKGKLYPVNPRYPEVAGVKCYPALADVPEIPDPRASRTCCASAARRACRT